MAAHGFRFLVGARLLTVTTFALSSHPPDRVMKPSTLLAVTSLTALFPSLFTGNAMPFHGHSAACSHPQLAASAGQRG
jgi:hypothetical protein